MKRLRKGWRRCLCGVAFESRSVNHRSCSACGLRHRSGQRCDSLLPCPRCEYAFARLARFNERRRNGEIGHGPGEAERCDACGLSYARFRSGFTFLDARRLFITDEPNRRTGKRMHGRRNQVLGKMKELKRLAWNAHLEACAATEVAA